MKTCASLLAAAALVLASLSLDGANAMPGYLQKLPNGGNFGQEIGHVGKTATPNDFGLLYSKADGDWAKLCKETFPAAGMTVGEALGDPCCKWKGGDDKPEFEVAAFTTTPPKKNECAANKAPASSAPAPAPAPAAAPTSSAPAPAPAGKPSGGKGDAAATPSAAPAPAGKPSSGNSTSPSKPGKSSKCGVKKESKSLDDDSDDSEEIDY